MAVSDTQMLNDLIARIERLERQMAQLHPTEMLDEMYGEQVDHTADRNERAEIARRGPGRPPGQK